MSEPQERVEQSSSRRRRWATAASVLGLLVLAPVCAEYLSAYDDSTGNPLRLIGGLLVFVPLYGCPALVIREVARRHGLGWPGIVLLGLAFGLVQAGLVDQSLFNDDYRDIAGWEQSYGTTLVVPLGFSMVNLLNFVGGHALFSMSAPIALVEAARPGTASRPWLGRPGLALAVTAWLGASWLVLTDTLRTEGPQASVLQLLGTGLLVLALVAAAVLAARSRRPVERTHPAVRTPVVFGTALVLAYVQAQAGESWTGVGVVLVTDAAAAVGLVFGSRGVGWSVRHVAAAAAAMLAVRVGLAFGYAPLVGDVAPAAALGHHVTMVVLVVVVGVLALRPRRDGSPDGRVPAARVEPGRTAG